MHKDYHYIHFVCSCVCVLPFRELGNGYTNSSCEWYLKEHPSAYIAPVPPQIVTYANR